MGLLQLIEQDVDLGGHVVVQLRIVGEGAVAAAGDDGLEGAEEWEEPGGIGIAGEFLEKGRGRGRLSVSRDWVTARAMRPCGKWFSPPSRR